MVSLTNPTRPRADDRRERPRRRSRQRYTGGFCVVALVVVLTACTNTAPDPTPVPPESQTAPVTAPDPTLAPVTTHEPAYHLLDLIEPGTEEVDVSALRAIGADQRPDLSTAMVLSEGLELNVADALVVEACLLRFRGP